MHDRTWLRLLLVTALGACSADVSPARQPAPEPVKELRTDLAQPSHAPAKAEKAATGSRSRTETDFLARFEAEVAKHPDLTYEGLARELSLAVTDAPLPFDPTTVQYYDRIAQQLALTEEEKAIFKKTGVVGVDHVRAYSIGSAYHAIYARDLPVLITADSMLHALHRSYDNILKEVETTAMSQALDETLKGAHDALVSRRSEITAPEVATSAADVDVYLTVARSLLAGSAVPSKLGKDAEVAALLQKIDALAMTGTNIYGGSRVVDYSQFRPRGHYTEHEGLKRYFRLMMWLGRADTGFVIGKPDPQSGLEIDVERETRNAALLTWALSSSGKLDRLRSAANVIDFLVGVSDDVTVDEAAKASAAAGLTSPAAFADAAKLDAFRQGLAQAGTQNIRSQFLVSEGVTKVEAPKLFQMFGQRFTVDSFVLSQVVFDSITFKGERVERMMPSGLDAMAALGSDEAARVLRPELEKFNYASNLLAARRVVEARRPETWSGDVYSMWVDALRTLNRAPAGAYAPAAMKGEAWRRKTLETQLSSWSQLRHDTILYAKQSYTAMPMCGYPAGYVEPYPDFFAKLQKLGRRAADGLKSMGMAAPSAHFQRFADVMQVLERMATKELAGKPFSSEEDQFIKATISISGGSGPPRYYGWYTTLVYGEKADKWRPTIADVHTDPESGSALEVGVGNVGFVVVAVDNGPDRAAYVGPISSFYEFRQPMAQRLTDEEWQKRITDRKIPPRPAFTNAYRGAPKERDLGPWTGPHKDDPRLEKLFKAAQSPTLTPQQRQKLEGDIEAMLEQIRNPPLPRPDGAPQAKR
jgi:hypothetical protein